MDVSNRIVSLLVLKEFCKSYFFIPEDIIRTICILISIIHKRTKIKIIAGDYNTAIRTNNNIYVWGYTYTSYHYDGGLHMPVELGLQNIKSISFTKNFWVALAFDGKIYMDRIVYYNTSVDHELNMFIKKNKIVNIRKIRCRHDMIVLQTYDTYYLLNYDTYEDENIFTMKHIQLSFAIKKLKMTDHNIFVLDANQTLHLDKKEFALQNIIQFDCENSHVVAVDKYYSAFIWKVIEGVEFEPIITICGQQIRNIVSVSCGNSYTLLLTKCGTLYEMSDSLDTISRLNFRYTIDPNLPQRIDLKNIIRIKCGENHVLVLTVEGIYVWGSNSDHKTGFGSESKDARLIRFDGEKFFL